MGEDLEGGAEEEYEAEIEVLADDAVGEGGEEPAGECYAVSGGWGFVRME